MKKSGSSGGVRREIDSFSWKSKRELEFKLRNTAYKFVSQFGLTYHNNAPADGRIVKNHLDRLLKRIRRKFPYTKYIWILEFQGREVPHYHLFLTDPPNPAMRKYLAHSWNSITEESPEHLEFHLHSNNFVDWEMNRPGYLTKYLSKDYQKKVPANYQNVGRFWGTSRGLVSEPEEITTQMFGVVYEPYVDTQTGEICDPRDNYKYVYRVLRKYHESTVRYNSRMYGKPRKYKSPITRNSGYLMMKGAPIVRRLLEYFERQYSIPF